MSDKIHIPNPSTESKFPPSHRPSDNTDFNDSLTSRPSVEPIHPTSRFVEEHVHVGPGAATTTAVHTTVPVHHVSETGSRCAPMISSTGTPGVADVNGASEAERVADESGAAPPKPGRIGGMAEKMIGSIKSGFGKVVGSQEMQEEGMREKAEGEARIQAAKAEQ
ncbi:hypothetical protein BC938DRAFT_474585 [Jimgerdemannia flammicorona]|uniref:CsbD-like domain-containing protein n=1 Tax=Jimgerdemannia flammicorona TaxID=994334 RepID=A0A433QSF1_9FUNG|nr:hypothetical protein BC938DRAFT_474585 [Jimgerdemannia flammicorona]